MRDARLPAELVLAAASGEQSAWDGLVARFGARMWAVARACGLGEQDAADAVQGAWLRLLQHLHTIREPAGVGAWLMTTVRREALQLLPKDRPLLAVVAEGPRAIEAFRALAGATDPVKAAPGTIRGDFALEVQNNIVHGSDSPESAAREVGLFFPDLR